MDWSEKNLCIRCNEGGNLLICSENDCPLAVHEGCLRFPVRFDDAGHFYCPHCRLKQAVAESRRACEYAQARKKALLAFMDEGMMDKEKHLEENTRAEVNGNNQSKVSEVNANITRGDGKRKRDSDSILDKFVHLDKEHIVSNAEEEKTQEEETGASAGSKREEPSLQMPKGKKISNEEEPKIQSSSALITDEVLHEKVKASRSSKQPQQPSVKLASDAYGSGKRRFWTEREEAELRAGVQKFSNEPNKNIPWRKILGLGQNVFDETRTPSDLKDKWRSMCKRSRTLG